MNHYTPPEWQCDNDDCGFVDQSDQNQRGLCCPNCGEGTMQPNNATAEKVVEQCRHAADDTAENPIPVTVEKPKAKRIGHGGPIENPFMVQACALERIAAEAEEERKTILLALGELKAMITNVHAEGDLDRCERLIQKYSDPNIRLGIIMQTLGAMRAEG